MDYEKSVLTSRPERCTISHKSAAGICHYITPPYPFTTTHAVTSLDISLYFYIFYCCIPSMTYNYLYRKFSYKKVKKTATCFLYYNLIFCYCSTIKIFSIFFLLVFFLGIVRFPPIMGLSQCVVLVL